MKDILLFNIFNYDAAVEIVKNAQYNIWAFVFMGLLLAVTFFIYFKNYSLARTTQQAALWNTTKLVIIGAVSLFPAWIYGTYSLASLIGETSPSAISRVFFLSMIVGMMGLVASAYEKVRVLIIPGIFYQTAVFGFGISVAVDCSVLVGIFLAFGGMLIAHLAAPIIYGLILITRTPLPNIPWLKRIPFIKI